VETELAEALGLQTPDPVVVRPARSGTDTAMLHLVRVVLDTEWSPEPAARRMLEVVGGDLRVLERIRARVLQAELERVTATTERALVTLDLALRAGYVR
jgi:hypothetical protein